MKRNTINSKVRANKWLLPIVLRGSGYFWLLAAAVVFSFVSPAFAGVQPSFFNSSEESNTDFSQFKKWTAALDKYSKEEASKKNGPCDGKELNSCTYGKWITFLSGIKDKDPATKIREVNNYMNRAPYITDDQNWGTKDYWSSPGEFMSKFGDCEDYAIAKYMSLRLLGFNEDEMRVVAVKDMNLKVGHAVLVIFLGGNTYILDNQIKDVVSTTKVLHYVPVFSINAKAWWKHIPAS